MTYNIPRKICFGGQTIKVKIMKDIGSGDDTGFYKCYFNLICVQTHWEGSLIAKEQVEQTFWHEYAHALLDHSRKEDLSIDEPLVDILGEFLYQSIGKSVKWR